MSGDGRVGDPLCDSGAESQQLDFASRVSSISWCIGKQTTTIIHCIITFVGSYYNKDCHVPTNVINPCICSSYYICGKSRYVCSRQRLLRLWKMNYICGRYSAV